VDKQVTGIMQPVAGPYAMGGGFEDPPIAKNIPKRSTLSA